MAKKVDLQERLNMRFLTVAYKDKQELYSTCCESADTGNIALAILNLPDSVMAELLELTDPMMELVDYLSNNRNPNNKVLGMMLTASKNVFRVVDLLREVPPFADQDFTWLDENLPKVFAPEKVTKAYTERKKEQGELFIQAMYLWNMFRRKRVSSAGCTMLLFQVCSAPIYMKPWMWAMHPSAVSSVGSSF